MPETYIIENEKGEWSIIRVDGLIDSIKVAVGKHPASPYNEYATAQDARTWNERPWRYLKLVKLQRRAWLFLKDSKTPIPLFSKVIANAKVAFDDAVAVSTRTQRRWSADHAMDEVFGGNLPWAMLLVMVVLGLALGFGIRGMF